MEPKSITLTLREEKKHSVRYDAPRSAEDPLVTSLYVMKSHLSRPFKKQITVTIKEEG